MRRGGVERVESDLGGFEKNRAIGGKAGGDQVLDDFVLRVDGDALARGEIPEVNAMAAAVEAELDAPVLEALTAQTIADAQFLHELDGVVFEEAGAYTLFNILARVELE